MANVLRLASPLQYDSIVDGPGVRMVVWTQGCPHHCAHCHNPQTWNMEEGTLYEVDALVKEIQEAQLQTGITFSGGEPFLQARQLLPLAIAAKKKRYSIWAYTGFQFEDIVQDEDKYSLLAYIDILVDGPFIETQKDYRLRFKGSRNQRIIDVAASLQANTIILSDIDKINKHLEP